MLQSLADPLFGVPFTLLLAIGGIGILAGAVVVAWPHLYPVDTETDRAAYFGGVGLAAIGVGSIALGFSYAGTMANIISIGGADSAVSPTFIGVIGQALPWTDIALVFGIIAVVALIGSFGVSVYTRGAADD